MSTSSTTGAADTLITDVSRGVRSRPAARVGRTVLPVGATVLGAVFTQVMG